MADNHLRFSQDHIWVRLEEENTAVLGITNEPLKLIQDFNRVKFPSEGGDLSKDEVFGAIKQDKKNLFSLISPLSGEVLAVNDDIEDAPDVLLEDNFEEGWLVRVLVQDPKEFEDLLTEEEYEDYVSEGDALLNDDGDGEYEPDEDDGEEDDDDDYYDDDDDDENY
jgi:glycine cleavage system H protein